MFVFLLLHIIYITNIKIGNTSIMLNSIDALRNCQVEELYSLTTFKSTWEKKGFYFQFSTMFESILRIVKTIREHRGQNYAIEIQITKLD